MEEGRESHRHRKGRRIQGWQDPHGLPDGQECQGRNRKQHCRFRKAVEPASLRRSASRPGTVWSFRSSVDSCTSPGSCTFRGRPTFLRRPQLRTAALPGQGRADPRRKRRADRLPTDRGDLGEWTGNRLTGPMANSVTTPSGHDVFSLKCSKLAWQRSKQCLDAF
jgi:hypothetical protein